MKKRKRDQRGAYARLSPEAKARYAMSQRKWKLKHLFGLTPEKVEQMIVEQEGLCKTCDAPLVRGKKTHIDHCHQTGVVRGILCQKCNHAIGLMDDNPARAERIAIYLRGT